MEINPRNLLMLDLWVNFHIETLNIPKTWNTTWECVIQKNHSVLHQTHQGLGQKKIIVHVFSKNAFRQGNSIYSCHSHGGFPKIPVLLWSVYDCLFSWTPCPGVMKIKKLWRFLNLTVIYSRSNSWLWKLSHKNFTRYTCILLYITVDNLPSVVSRDA